MTMHMFEHNISYSDTIGAYFDAHKSLINLHTHHVDLEVLLVYIIESTTN